MKVSTQVNPLISYALLLTATIGAAPLASAGGGGSGLDPSFDGDGLTTFNIGTQANDAWPADMGIQADGKIVIAGESRGSGAVMALVRYNPDGSLDSSFDGDGVVTTNFSPGGDAQATCMAIQSDGKIVAGGGEYPDNGTQYAVLARFNPDGSLDASFGGDGRIIERISTGGNGDRVMDLAIQPDGRIVVVIALNHSGLNVDWMLLRYNTDGSLDEQFGGALAQQMIPSLPLGESYPIMEADSIALQSDGSIVVAGEVDSNFAVMRFTSGGLIDVGFGNRGIAVTGLSNVTEGSRDLIIQADGKLLIAGCHGCNHSQSDLALVRFNPDGSLDTSFDADGVVRMDLGSNYDVAEALMVRPDGKILAVGWSSFSQNSDLFIARFHSDGSPDTSFDGNGWKTVDFIGGWDAGQAVAMQSDGSIVTASMVSDPQWDQPQFGAARLFPDGTLDPKFDGDGRVMTTLSGPSGDDLEDSLLQADGKIVSVGYTEAGGNSTFVVTRQNPDGSLDTSFDGDGIQQIGMASEWWYATSLAIQFDGKIVVAGASEEMNGLSQMAAARLNADGSLDTSFDGDGIVEVLFPGAQGAYAQAVGIQANGKIVLGGSSENGSTDHGLARLNSDGTLDTSFGVGGRVMTDLFFGSYEDIQALLIQSDGGIVVAGSVQGNSPEDFAVVRYTSAGDLDTTFSGDGIATTDFGFGSRDRASSLAIQSDGKLLVAGYSDVGGDRDVAIARYLVNGALDTSFDGDGMLLSDFSSGQDDRARDVAVRADGRIVVAGASRTSSEDYDFVLAIYMPDGSLETAFNGTGWTSTDFGQGSNDNASALALQSDGKVVIAGSTGDDFAMARYEVVFTSSLLIEPGTAFCFCEGLGTCDNGDPDAGCANSSGKGASLLASGSSFLQENDLSLSISGLPPERQVILAMGAGQRKVVFGDGQRCIGSGLIRVGLGLSGMHGEYSTSFGNAKSLGILAGESRSFQAVYRDPAGPCGSGYNTTNAYRVVFMP